MSASGATALSPYLFAAAPPPGSIGYLVPGGVVSTTSVSARLGLSPILVPRALRIDRIAAEVTAVGDGVGRLGLYKADAYGRPDVLLVDAGTVDVTTTGIKAAVVDLALAPGIYFAAAVFTFTTTAPTFRGSTGGYAQQPATVLGDPNPLLSIGYYVSGQDANQPLRASMADAVAAPATVIRTGMRVAV